MAYERPVLSRYLDPLEVVWLATAKRLKLTIRRDPAIFSRTDGSGMLWLGPRDDLDADDTLCQMLFHEIVHWITNGEASYHLEDWGFPLDDADDVREFSCLRLQACLADRYGLRGMLGPTGKFREYFDKIPADPLEPLDDSSWEAEIVALAAEAIARAVEPPWGQPLAEALEATRQFRSIVRPFLADYATEIDDDPLPSLWSR